jgi:hypothetical protein
MSQQRWHTVRFVDEPEPPHLSHPSVLNWWHKVRGKEVQIRRVVNRWDVKTDLSAECDCERFFEFGKVGSGLVAYIKDSKYFPVVCRRLLEMD